MKPHQGDPRIAGKFLGKLSGDLLLPLCPVGLFEEEIGQDLRL